MALHLFEQRQRVAHWECLRCGLEEVEAMSAQVLQCSRHARLFTIGAERYDSAMPQLHREVCAACRHAWMVIDVSDVCASDTGMLLHVVADTMLFEDL